jgi:hypothetical protein
MTSLLRLVCFLLLIAWCIPDFVQADIFHLSTGGRLEGDLLNRVQSPRKNYIVRTPSGGTITLTRLQVRKVVGKTDEQREYESLLAGLDDSAEGHWEMSQFCLEKKLTKQRSFHLAKVLVLDPEHAAARTALGYSKQAGQWVTRTEWQQKRGFILYQGSWRTSQEIASLKSARTYELAVKGWNRDLKRWRTWLYSKKRYQEALHNIKQIKDGRAAMGISEWIDEEENREVKLLLVDVLGELPGSIASQALVKASIFDESNSVRDSAVDRMVKRDDRYRATARLIKELGSKNNKHVNYAAVGLGRLKDTSAILPLIDALTTQHKFIVTTGRPGNAGASFGGANNGTGGGTFSAGGGSKVKVGDRQNPEVLRALVAITKGANFQYDKDRWRQWYDDQATPGEVSLRRDDS